MHQSAADYVNSKQLRKQVYKEEEKVGYQRPVDLTASLQSKWTRPCKISKRVGEGSYLVEVKPVIEHEAHDDQLWKYVLDEYAGTPKPFFYYQGSSKDIDWQMDEYEAEKFWRTGGVEMVHMSSS